jgi:folate-binding protein YgfZ
VDVELYRALHQHAGWIERGDVGRLWVRGEDRRSYLHNLLTNDIEGLSAGESRYAALLTPQGRMVTDMHVIESGDSMMLMVPRELTSAVRERFEQFIFSEDVRIEDATASTVQVGIYGPAADDVVNAFRDETGLAIMPADEFGLAGFEVIVTSENRAALFAKLAGITQVTVDVVETCRIEAGVPRFLADMTGDTIPLEAGIEDRAISLTKGCYVGQEIIIRILHRGGGRVARRLVRIGFEAGAPVPAAGAVLYADDREIGVITSATQSPAFGRPVALGYVHRDFAGGGASVDVRLDDERRVAGEIFSR